MFHTVANASFSKAGLASGQFSWPLVAAALFGFAANAFVPNTSIADENGISFWLPGQLASLAALRAQPGWSFAAIYYHTSLAGEGAVYAAREVNVGGVTRTANLNLNVSGHGPVDLQLLNATYVSQTPVLGGQFALSMAVPVGYRTSVSINGTLTTPVGTRQGEISDSRSGFGDLYPMATIKWHQGVHSYMTYLTGDIPVGTYDATRLANFGIGHGAIDGGVGYTYADLTTGREFSVVTGLTYNFKNTNTDYQNGVDWHLDWGASQFLSKEVHIGVVGYFYQQLTADSGAAPILGDMISRVIAVGPQIGYVFPVGDMHGYLNLKAYREFDAKNRPEGWNTWLTLAISPAEPKAVNPRRH
jgi:hypothetical protein